MSNRFCIASLLSPLGPETASERHAGELFTSLQHKIEALRQNRRGLGVADLASGRPVTANTLFQAQSIAKTLTSSATVKLVASRDIALIEPVNRYLKGLIIPNNEYTEKVQVSFRMLLNHTGGISNPNPDGCCGPQETLPTLQQILRGLPPATNKPIMVERIPGRRFDYCNGCNTVLQTGLESISQQPFPVLMQELVLKPAGIVSSTFSNDFVLNDSSTIASPYDVDDQPHRRTPMRNPILSTGLIWSTASDLARF